MHDLIRRIPWPGSKASDVEPLLTREWVVTNALGGYSSGTISGVATRRYHGLLIAALPSPLGRVVMFNHLSELMRLPDGTMVRLGGEERANGDLEVAGAPYHTEFRLEAGLPIWRFEVNGFVMEKRLFLRHLQNTVQITYKLLEGDGIVRLKLRPSLHYRPHEAPVNQSMPESYVLTAAEDRLEIHVGDQFPPLRLLVFGERKTFTLEGKKIDNLFYRVEASRGYEEAGDLWNPGRFSVDLKSHGEATLIASTDPWEMILAMDAEEAYHTEIKRRRHLISRAEERAQSSPAAELVLGADQFIIEPAGRMEAAAVARAAGDEARTVIAGYHWFTDWGRDTMISLEGLTLVTGRYLEARWILKTFAHYVKDGLIPNMFPEGENEGLYHTADATLWFFHALHRYVEATGDRETLKLLLPKMVDIVNHHLKGTRFGIGVDPEDGLLRQGASGYQLTWMDAKVGDWVVTPRRGKAVEINALWYNALRLAEGWVREMRGESSSKPFAEAAERAYQSFNRKFWNDRTGYLYDIVDSEQGGSDPACRPNQIFSISLDHPVLEPKCWKRVLDVVQSKLLTPVGLRSLSSDHPDYKSKYYGDLRSRDAAYHQGTVWGWLMGPFVDAWLKVHPNDLTTARSFLQGFLHHLDEACVGSVSEIFDAEPPFMPRGCIAQAWSVAELLRCWVKTEK